MQFIIKTIQGCNLSCVYCYEQPQNQRHQELRLEDAKLFLRKVFDYYATHDPSEGLAFHWHGGEPMLRGAGFFEELIGFQAREFGDRVRWFNTLQTNLTLLDDEFILLLQRHAERLVLGISCDFFGEARVDNGNRPTNERVLRNARRLRDAGIRTNFMTMLTKENVARIDELYELLRGEEVSIRFNQIFDAPRRRAFGRPPVRLTNREFSAALMHITRRWMADPEAKCVIDNAERIMVKVASPCATKMCWFEKKCLEGHMAICPDGQVFPCDSVYYEEFSYGNVFAQPYEEILAASARRKLLAALDRTPAGCEACEYLSYCNGGCPSRSLHDMTRRERMSADFRFGRDPLCRGHHEMFQAIGDYLAENAVVPEDWSRRPILRVERGEGGESAAAGPPRSRTIAGRDGPCE